MAREAEPLVRDTAWKECGNPWRTQLDRDGDRTRERGARGYCDVAEGCRVLRTCDDVGLHSV